MNNNEVSNLLSQAVAPSNFYAPRSDLPSSPSTSSNETAPPPSSLTTNERNFRQFLSQSMNDKTVSETIRYSRMFAHVLQTGDASSLLQVSPDKRIHIMKSLASLARFTGSYDYWMQIKRRYNLTWTNGNENLAAFERFFDNNKTLDSMLQWVRDAIQVLPPHMGEIIKFNVLTGLRPNEAIAAVRLINNTETFKTLYNPERQTLQYFRFPQRYLRRTKSAYISIITKEQLSGIAPLRGKIPTYEVIRFRLERTSVKCHLSYCRKIYGSWLRKEGIESEIVELLSGRVPKSVFTRHYLSPSNDLKDRILTVLTALKQVLEQP